MNPWIVLTALGDANITLPAAMVIALWLIASGARRLALYWCVLFGAMLACVVLTKLAFIGWGIGLAALDFTGISGHSSRAAAVLPTFVFMLCWKADGTLRRRAVALSYLLAALVAASRVVIEAHSVAEALIGFGLGCAVSALFIWYAGRYDAKSVSKPLVFASVFILCILTLLGPAPTKAWMREAALYLSDRREPFRRGEAPEERRQIPFQGI